MGDKKRALLVIALLAQTATPNGSVPVECNKIGSSFIDLSGDEWRCLEVDSWTREPLPVWRWLIEQEFGR